MKLKPVLRAGCSAAGWTGAAVTAAATTGLGGTLRAMPMNSCGGWYTSGSEGLVTAREEGESGLATGWALGETDLGGEVGCDGTAGTGAGGGTGGACFSSFFGALLEPKRVLKKDIFGVCVCDNIFKN